MGKCMQAVPAKAVNRLMEKHRDCKKYRKTERKSHGNIRKPSKYH